MFCAPSGSVFFIREAAPSYARRGAYNTFGIYSRRVPSLASSPAHARLMPFAAPRCSDVPIVQRFGNTADRTSLRLERLDRLGQFLRAGHGSGAVRLRETGQPARCSPCAFCGVREALEDGSLVGQCERRRLSSMCTATRRRLSRSSSPPASLAQSRYQSAKPFRRAISMRRSIGFLSIDHTAAH